MYELIQVGPKTYYMNCPAKVGFYETGDGNVVCIDGGSDTDAGKKVKKILDAKGWTLTAIFNTHAHADHIGGNAWLQRATGCRIYAPGAERAFAEYPFLESVMLFGGFAPHDLHNKFLLAEPSNCLPLTDDVLPDGLSRIDLPGHCLETVGYASDDGTVFLGDALLSETALEKYGVGFVYDVKSYLETLTKLKNLPGTHFVPSHADATADIVPLAQKNIDKTLEVIAALKKILTTARTFDETLTAVFDAYGLRMNVQQYALVGCTLRSYLSYLKENGDAEILLDGNRLLWHTV